MKLLFAFSFSMALLTVNGQDIFDRQDAFFSTYVVDGKVDYKAIQNNPETLDELVKEIADYDLSNKRVNGDFLKAFYINAYNILVIKQVVSLYPIKGPLAVDGFFNKIEHVVMGEKATLDGLEKGTLYKQFLDPRLHFVLVCAADGCPPIASEAFKPEGLDDQLTARTRYVLNLDWFIRFNKKVGISQIFEWYQKDFTENGSVIDFINVYRDEQINKKAKTTFYTYEWSLNDID